MKVHLVFWAKRKADGRITERRSQPVLCKTQGRRYLSKCSRKCKGDLKIIQIAVGTPRDGCPWVVALPYFLTDALDASIDRMLDHIDYVVQLVGHEHVAIGTDWPIQAPDAVLHAAMGGETYSRKVGWTGEYRRDVGEGQTAAGGL